MDQRHLPDPSKVGTHVPGGSLESVVAGAPVPEVQDFIQLAPIHQHPGHYEDPSSSAMLRDVSISSTSSFENSIYYCSPSASPLISHLEPAELGPRCPACLEIGENVLLDASKSCPECGLIDHKPNFTGKVPRKKRNDRFRYAPQAPGSGAARIVKSNGEAYRRANETSFKARLQNAMLAINPSLPDNAAPYEGREQCGWKLLSGWNTSKDIKENLGIDTLMYNKMCILGSSLIFMNHSSAIIEDAKEEIKDLKAEANDLLSSEPSREELLAFVTCVSKSGLDSRIAESGAQRGGQNWRSPSQLQFTKSRL